MCPLNQLPPFDTLKQMARDNPAALEQLRQKMIKRLIDAAPKEKRRRLRGLQFQIDAIRATTKTPLRSCQLLSEMMLQAFTELNYRLNKPYSNNHNNRLSSLKAKPEVSVSGKILPFTPRHST